MSPITRRIVAALAVEPLGAAELARRVHGEPLYVMRRLQALHRDGLVQFHGMQHAGKVGRPAKLFGLAA